MNDRGRNLRRWIPSASVALATLASFAQAQDPPPRPRVRPPEERLEPLPVPDDAPEAIRKLVDELAREGVRVDFERKRVEVKGAILLDRMMPGYPIEYLVVTEEGFTHEALGIVRCVPSKLNAAFLALGLQPGRTVRFERKEPPPPVDRLRDGTDREVRILPPEGPVVDILVRWTDEAGRERLHPIEDLVRYVTNGRSVARRGFVYVGSRFHTVVMDGRRQQRYMADLEGNIVSLYLAGFGNCLFDMNGIEGVESYLYDVNSDLCPPKGTKVTFVFVPRLDP